MAVSKGLHNHTPAIAVLLVATALLYFVNKERTDRLYDELAVFKNESTSTFNAYKKLDDKRAVDAKTYARELNTGRQQQQDEAVKDFEDFVADTAKKFGVVDKKFLATHESIKHSNVEVEQIKRVLSGLDDHVTRKVEGRIGEIERTIDGTNGRVSANAGKIETVKNSMESGFGGIAEFYKDIKAQTEWAVHGPGGCNDVFANGEAKHPWKLTRSFVHSRQKIELEQCKMFCKTSDWGCKYVSFYGAGKGWCYGFQSCDSHTTGQGWGGYTTYARRELEDNLNDYVKPAT